jgi:hypothetical protein
MLRGYERGVTCRLERIGAACSYERDMACIGAERIGAMLTPLRTAW